MTTATRVTWKLQGDALGACSCDWGCPCNFDAPPTQGWCEGGYAFHINTGNLNEVPLAGLTVGFFAHSPAALHLGNVTAYLLVDEKATAAQREAIGQIFGGQVGGVFGALGSLITKVIGPDYTPVEWKFDGTKSSVKFGNHADVRLAEIKNPVTGEASGFSLKFSNGLLTDEAQLMTTSKMSINHPEIRYDHTGKYGETFHFNYSGEA